MKGIAELVWGALVVLVAFAVWELFLKELIVKTK
jgi:hypothetical protein